MFIVQAIAPAEKPGRYKNEEWYIVEDGKWRKAIKTATLSLRKFHSKNEALFAIPRNTPDDFKVSIEEWNW